MIVNDTLNFFLENKTHVKTFLEAFSMLIVLGWFMNLKNLTWAFRGT